MTGPVLLPELSSWNVLTDKSLCMLRALNHTVPVCVDILQKQLLSWGLELQQSG